MAYGFDRKKQGQKNKTRRGIGEKEKEETIRTKINREKGTVKRRTLEDITGEKGRIITNFILFHKTLFTSKVNTSFVFFFLALI